METKLIILIIFIIANILTSLLGTIIVKAKYPNMNKYILFTIFFIGYLLLFLTIKN